MFNLYSTMNKHNEEKQKESPTTGHDRFSQIRVSRTSYRKKRRPMQRRAHSAAEFDTAALTAANKRNAFGAARSSSTEQPKEEEKTNLVVNKFDSLTKLFSKASLGNDKKQLNGHTGRYHYSALDGAALAPDRGEADKRARERALAACTLYLGGQEPGGTVAGRYELLAHLDDIGSRIDKHWFIVKDGSVKTERLMTLVPVTKDCPLECTDDTRDIILDLFGGLQHPYIYPVLDLGFMGGYATLVMPFNPQGSLKDLIYKSYWQEPYSCKYSARRGGLNISQVQRLGRQILEALLFLKERGLQGHGHLHSGNVILQNGVARLSGLENMLLGLPARFPVYPAYGDLEQCDTSSDLTSFGHILFEMCAGYELTHPQPSARHLQLDLEKYPQVVEILQLIFAPPDGRSSSIQELLLCDLFRNIDLREMRGSCIPHVRLSNNILELLSVVRRKPSTRNGYRGEHVSPPTMQSPSASSNSNINAIRKMPAVVNAIYEHRNGTRSEPCTPPRTPLRRHSFDVATLHITNYQPYDKSEIKIAITPPSPINNPVQQSTTPTITITLADSIVEDIN